jgi:hypothetical protein
MARITSFITLLARRRRHVAKPHCDSRPDARRRRKAPAKTPSGTPDLELSVSEEGLDPHPLAAGDVRSRLECRLGGIVADAFDIQPVPRLVAALSVASGLVVALRTTPGHHDFVATPSNM